MEKRFLEIYKKKRYEEITKQYKSYFIAEMLVEDFRYTSFTICSMMVELLNFNNLYKLVEGYDYKRLVTLFKSIVKSQGVNSSKSIRDSFVRQFTDYTFNSKVIFTTDFKEEYKTGADIINSLSSMMLFYQENFQVVLNRMEHKKEYAEILDLTVDFMLLIKDKIKKPKVSKNQNLVGKNLKNWRG